MAGKVILKNIVFSMFFMGLLGTGIWTAVSSMQQIKSSSKLQEGQKHIQQNIITQVPTLSTAPSVSIPTGAKHFFIIVMENKDEGSVIGNSSAAYINNLAKAYAYASNYFAVSHPSLPNYIALASGDTFGINTDCTRCFLNKTNITDEIESAGHTWKGYFEDMPSPCFVGTTNKYAQKHNPFIYFDDIRTNGARCAAHLVPLTEFYTDASRNALPDYTWITPNICHDMHDCPVSTGDAWLSQIVPTIMTTNAYKDNGVLFITWDEGSTSGNNKVATLIISPQTKKGFVGTKAEDHYSILRTIEDAWRLPPLGRSTNESAMSEYF